MKKYFPYLYFYHIKSSFNTLHLLNLAFQICSNKRFCGRQKKKKASAAHWESNQERLQGCDRWLYIPGEMLICTADAIATAQLQLGFCLVASAEKILPFLTVSRAIP